MHRVSWVSLIEVGWLELRQISIAMVLWMNSMLSEPDAHVKCFIVLPNMEMVIRLMCMDFKSLHMEFVCSISMY